MTSNKDQEPSPASAPSDQHITPYELLRSVRKRLRPDAEAHALFVHQYQALRETMKSDAHIKQCDHTACPHESHVHWTRTLVTTICHTTQSLRDEIMAADIMYLLRRLPASYTAALLPPSEISSARATGPHTILAGFEEGVRVQFRNPKPCQQEMALSTGL